MKKKRINLEDIEKILGDLLIATYGQKDNVFIDNLADTNNVNENTLDWINLRKDNAQHLAEITPAKVVLAGPNVVYSNVMRNYGKILLIVKDPHYAIAKVGNAFFVKKENPFIHPTAIISPGATIGKDVYIGPFVVIGESIIGDGCYISSNVKIYDNTSLGHNCIVKEGAVLGGAGFGFEVDYEGNHFRFPQIGGLIIGNNVEIGANTCIDRGALSDTIIGDYVKIDNLVHIAHNVRIGNNAMVIACSEISGSCIIGDNAWIGPNSAIREWLNIGKNALIGVGGVVVKNIPDGEIWAGNPAKKIK